jgi:hypothetical protein
MSLITCCVCGKVDYVYMGRRYCRKHSTNTERVKAYYRRKNERT